MYPATKPKRAGPVDLSCGKLSAGLSDTWVVSAGDAKQPAAAPELRVRTALPSWSAAPTRP